MGLKRADVLLCDQGLCRSREQAQRLIEQKKVLRLPDLLCIDKASRKLEETTLLQVIENEKYVSRGAYKLEIMAEKYNAELHDATVIDIGASTGGFTDLMLQHGAKKVYAVDCGQNQLHEKLRGDARVVNCEKYNARELNCADFPGRITVAVMDVSFISATLILPALDGVLSPGALAFILVKPQFEAGRSAVGKNGVVKSVETQLECVAKVVDFARDTLKWKVLETGRSPIDGPQGNHEYVAVFRKEA